MSINRRDIIQMLRDENELLKARNRQTSNKLARLHQAFRVLIEIDESTQNLSEATDIPVLCSQMLELVLHVCNTEDGSLILLDENSQELEFVEVIGSSREALLNHRISIDTGIVGNSIKTGESILMENVHSSKRWSSAIDEYLDFHTESLMCVPVKVENHVIGAIELVNHTGDSVFDENDLNVFRIAVSFVGRVLERVEKNMISGEEKA